MPGCQTYHNPEVEEDVLITEEHLHPAESIIAPSGTHRHGGITFTVIADGNRVRVAGSVTIDYYWYNAPGVPGANQVFITRQGVLKDDVLLLCKAIRGEADPNISYGAGVAANPDVSAFWTSQRFNVGTVAHAAGQSAMFRDMREDEPDTTQTINLTTTATVALLTDMVRVWSTRYVFPAGGAQPNNRVAGAMQTIYPIGAVPQYKFDPNLAVVEAVSNINIVFEGDFYWSLDEVTFTRFINGLNMSRESVNAGSQQYLAPSPRVSAGAGIYMRGRSNASAAESVDMKLQYHKYESGI